MMFGFLPPGVARVDAIDCSADPASPRSCELLEEEPLVVDVEGVGRYTLMWTPTDTLDRRAKATSAESIRANAFSNDDAPITWASGFVPADGWLGEAGATAALELAAGFVFGEGLIDGVDELVSLARCPRSPDVVRVALVDAARQRTRPAPRTVYAGCGVCGADHLPQIRRAAPRRAAGLSGLRRGRLHELVLAMQERQSLWQRTGAAHAALVFDVRGEILAFAEDLGRHNALDQAIGSCLLAGRSLAGGGVLLSSRCSYEMLARAARAGLSIVAAVSAPTALAVRTAQAHGITLCGFVRDGRATVYTHPERIGLAPARVGITVEPARAGSGRTAHAA